MLNPPPPRWAEFLYKLHRVWVGGCVLAEESNLNVLNFLWSLTEILHKDVL
jgi:hypothetical protein